MKLLDLFSGIGGFSLAARWTGRIETVSFCETDPYCCRVLAKNFPGVPIYGDIRKLKGVCVGPADIVSGGFPCQPFSVAGKRGGKEDDRYLWPEMLRVISDVRPAWILGENVDGLVRMGVQFGVPEVASRNIERTQEFDRFRRIFARQETMLLFSILDDLEALGYGAVPLVIPACGVDAPHLRYRVWIVANSERRGCGSDRKRESVEGIRGRRPDNSMPVEESSPYVAHTEGDRRGSRRTECAGQQRRIALDGASRYVADSPLWENIGRERGILEEEERSGRGVNSPAVACGEDVPHTDRPGCGKLRRAESIGEEYAAVERRGGWLPEPGICRVVDGVPARVDRLRSLGNAIVPQVAYEIMMAILAADAGLPAQEWPE